MNKLIAVIGASGVGKTTFVQALARSYPFAAAYEQHAERPFQASFKKDGRYAFANQMDYLVLRAEQEQSLRACDKIGLIDGGLDLDFHGFTRLFHRRGMLTDAEFDLCRRLYDLFRAAWPYPELIVRLHADEITVAARLATRTRINIARSADTALFNSFLDEWLKSIPASRILELDVSNETAEYQNSVEVILNTIRVWQ
jgi:deoxyadenosine/deoxycytidine kinase